MSLFGIGQKVTICIPDYHEIPEGCYILDEDFRYYSARYGKSISGTKGYVSDGATGAFDIRSLGWWAHDVACERCTWDDGSEITRWQASQILQDILEAEGYWWRSKYWFWATYYGGGKKLKAGRWKGAEFANRTELDSYPEIA